MEITSVPAAEQERLWDNRKDKLSKYYTKYLNVEGIAIMSSDNVDDNIFYKAKDIVLKVTSKHPQFRRDLSRARLLLAAPGKWIQSLPEVQEFFLSRYGYTYILADEVKFCAAVVEWEGRPNMGVFTHELGHAIVPSIDRLEPNFEGLLGRAYERAMALETWEDPLMSKNPMEYWAEGVKLWTHDVGTGRQFETKEAFMEHDKELADLLDTWLHIGDIPYEY